MKLLVATTNPGKIAEYRELLDDPRLEVVGLRDRGIDFDVEETRSTFEENARLKARAYADAGGLLTLADASWLNQAELLLKSFEVRYLPRGDWASRQHLIDHLCASTPEYNRLWARPINWSWTRRDLHAWADKKTAELC